MGEPNWNLVHDNVLAESIQTYKNSLGEDTVRGSPFLVLGINAVRPSRFTRLEVRPTISPRRMHVSMANSTMSPSTRLLVAACIRSTTERGIRKFRPGGSFGLLVLGIGPLSSRPQSSTAT